MNPQLTAVTKLLEEMGQKPNVFGSVSASLEGLLLTSHFPAGVDKRHFAAMGATMTSAAMAMGTSIGSISPNNIRVNLDHHEIFCTFCSKEHILVIIFDKTENNNLDLLKPFIEQIQKLSKDF